ncbi:MAG: hypothetical protein AAGB51_05695 [Planctomycetota bacterium]
MNRLVATAVMLILGIGAVGVSQAQTGDLPDPIRETPTGWTLRLAHPAAGFHPIRDGVRVTKEQGAADEAPVSVRYERSSGAASGVAYRLPSGALDGVSTLRLEAMATPSQRLTVCLTDETGFVWSFPTVRLTDSMEVYELKLSALRADPFQNQGKAQPAEIDLGSIQTLTLLDITGFMGAPKVQCDWRIESFKAERDQ